MENKNEFKENLIKMANSNKKNSTINNKENKNVISKIGENARKVLEIIEHGEKEDGR